MITLQSGLTISNHNFSIVLSHPSPSRVILAVPHDGLISNDFSGMFQARTSGLKGRDTHVWPVANDIVQKALQLGTRIDTVRFLMARAYVDANREMPDESNLDPDTCGQTALDDLLLSSVYQSYHSELCRLVERSMQTFDVEQILFIDLHGFGRQPKIAPPEGYDLILGTANRTTIYHGEVDRTFVRFMEECGYSVFLPGEQPIVPKGDPFSAGHTTRWYAKRYGINAIQIEIFSTFRRREGQAQGEKLATDIAKFLSKHYR
ncbi:MAG: N-formylglutamate amidohydrolase [Patescibacteria group bacterium]